MTDADPSILSHGEREIAALLDDGYAVEDVAAARDDPVETVEKAVDRIREKTDRALATLAVSPFTDAAAADLDAATRERLRDRLSDPDEEDTNHV